MKVVLILTFIFTIIALTCIGCLMIFGIFNLDQALDFGLRIMALIALLSISSVGIALVTGKKKTPGE